MRMKVILTSALFLSAAFPAFAESWTAITKLSGIPSAGSTSVAIDAAGNAVAVWREDSTCGQSSCSVLRSRTRADGKLWGAVTTVSVRDPLLQASYPTLNVSEAGNATAVWVDDSGLKTADKPFGKPWTKPTLLLPTMQTIYSYGFVENRKGDGVILIDSTILRRTAAGAWRTVVSPLPASVPNSFIDSVALGLTGELVASWESYDRHCNAKRRCFVINFRLHAARLASGASTWVDSGVLAGPDSGAGTSLGDHGGVLAIDDRGRVGLISVQNGTTYTVLTNTPGQPWSAAVPLAPTISVGMINGFQSDATGDATVLVTETGGRVSAIAGSLGGGAFALQASLSGSDRAPFNPLLAMSPSGSAAATWGFGDPNFSPSSIAVTTRPNANAPWRARTDLTGVLQAARPQSIAAAGVDRAVAGWDDYDNTETISRANAGVHQP